MAELDGGGDVVVGRVEAFLDGGGLRVRAVGGEELVAHEARWFAWSQFHPDTLVWAPVGP
jgi:hypothetical protein